MTKLRAVAVLSGLLLGSCIAPSPPPGDGPALDDLIAFDDPATCRLAPGSAKLLDGFVRNNLDTLNDDWIRPGTVPAELRDRFGPIEVSRHQGFLLVRTHVRGALWGLPLTAIAHEIPEGGDPGALTFEFAAGPHAVERAARARGFVARANADVAMTEPDALTPTISLHPDAHDPRRAHLSCGYT